MSGAHHRKGGKRKVVRQAAGHAARKHGPSVASNTAKIVAKHGDRRHERRMARSKRVTNSNDVKLGAIKMLLPLVVLLVVLAKCAGGGGGGGSSAVQCQYESGGTTVVAACPPAIAGG